MGGPKAVASAREKIVRGEITGKRSRLFSGLKKHSDQGKQSRSDTFEPADLTPGPIGPAVMPFYRLKITSEGLPRRGTPFTGDL